MSRTSPTLRYFLSLATVALIGGAAGGLGVLAVVDGPGHAGAQLGADGRAASRTGAAAFAALAAGAPDDFRSAADRSMAGVVHISAYAEQRLTLWDYYSGRRPQLREGTGSGVIYRRDGYIVTNNHVVANAREVYVSLNDNRRFRAEVVGTYPAADLAVLRVEAGEALPELPFANSDQAAVGDWVLAVGNPYDLTSTVTAGIISARGRDIGIISERNAIESFIQTDAAINPGNSGGALVNTDGEVIGINTAIYSRSGGYAGYGFAIPANLAARIADDIIATGSFRQTVLGVDATELDEEYARELGVGVTQGVVLEEVDAGGLAGRAGLRAGDIIVSADGRPVRSIAEFREAVASSPRGTRLDVGILRGRRALSVALAL